MLRPGVRPSRRAAGSLRVSVSWRSRDAGSLTGPGVKMAAVTTAPIRERLNWEPDHDTYQAIRRLWINHSKAEDARDLQGLIDTLSPDCVYEIVPTGQRWEGHAGARAFYTELFRAFPDNAFALSEIVIGP